VPNYADDFARFLQAWPSQPVAVPALDDPLAIYPWARGLQPFLVPMSHQQSTPWFDPARQPNLVPLDVNPVAQAAPAPAAATPSSSWPGNADTLVAESTPAPAMASAIRDRPQAAAAGGVPSDAATSGAPWWLDRYDAALPNTTRVNPDPAAPVAVDVGTDQSLKAWPSDDPYVREGAYAADQAAAAKLRRPDLPGLAYYTAHPDIVAAREAGLGGIATLAGPLPAAVLAGIDYAAAAQSGDTPLSAADFDQQPLKPWPSDDPYIREGAYAADQAAAAKLRRPDLAGLAYGHRPDVRAARDAAFAALPSMLPAGEFGALGGRAAKPRAPVLIGSFVPPVGLNFGSGLFGDHAHEQVANIIKTLHPDVGFVLQVERGAQGIDVRVPKKSISKVGFEHAEIKPLTLSGKRRMLRQIEDWGLDPNKVRAITYDGEGKVYYGFGF
jgi:hypothetical protein